MSEATSALYGVGFRSQHYEWVTTHRPSEIDAFEIVSDNFMGVGGRPHCQLEKLRQDFPILMHGVGLSIGSAVPLDRTYLQSLKGLVDRLEPLLVSDHLSWGHLGLYNSHDLLPIVYTKQSLGMLTDKLHAIQDFLGRRFYLENPSAYVSFRAGDYSEADFFVELLDRSGAGILLDLNNLYVNARNLGRSPDHLLRALRPEHIGYFHLAGHSSEVEVLVDTHDQPVSVAVWDLFAKAKAYFPGKPAIIEWDGKIPEFAVLAGECEKARGIKASVQITAPSVAHFVPSLASGTSDEGALYEHFFEQIRRPHGLAEDGEKDLVTGLPTPARRGLSVYNHAYFSRLEELLKENFPALAFILGEKTFPHLVVAYLKACPPQGYGLDLVGRGLSLYLRDPGTELAIDAGVPLQVLADLSALEWAQCEAATAEDQDLLRPVDVQCFTPEDWEQLRFRRADHLRLVECEYAVLPVLQAISAKEPPSKPKASSVVYFVYRDGFGVREREASGEEARFARKLQEPATFLELSESISLIPGVFDAALMNRVAAMLMEFCSAGFLVAETKRG